MTKLLTIDEIKALSGLNTEAIKFYLEMAQTHLEDTLNIKRELDQKAVFLFGGYIAAAFALFGMADRYDELSYWLVASALFFCCGVAILFVVIRIEDYATLGRNPKDWLGGSEYLTASDKYMGHIYAYVLHGYIEPIEMNKRSNKNKIFYLNISIVLGFLSLSPLIIRAIFA